MVEKIAAGIKKTDFVKGINYFKEMYIHQITDKWGIDISALAEVSLMKLSVAIKRLLQRLIQLMDLPLFGLLTVRAEQAPVITLKKPLT